MAKGMNWDRARKAGSRYLTGNYDRELARELRRLGVPMPASAWDPGPLPAARPSKPPVRFGPRR